MENCTFSNNTGGAIGDLSTQSYICKSTFHNNSNCQVHNSLGRGGAVYTTSPHVVIDTCNFLGNAAADGGAVFALENSATVLNTCFRENAASPTLLQRRTGGGPLFSDTQDGGALYILGDSSVDSLQQVYVINSTFLHNFAWGSAGAIRSWQLPELCMLVSPLLHTIKAFFGC